MAVRKLLSHSSSESIFKLRVVFNELSTDPNFVDRHGNIKNKEVILYSYDYEDERRETKRSKPMEEYNGYKRMFDFVTKVARTGNLKIAQIYANRLPDRPLLDTWEPDIRPGINEKF